MWSAMMAPAAQVLRAHAAHHGAASAALSAVTITWPSTIGATWTTPGSPRDAAAAARRNR